MITDPKTTLQSRTGQCSMVIMVAVVETIFRCMPTWYTSHEAGAVDGHPLGASRVPVPEPALATAPCASRLHRLRSSGATRNRPQVIVSYAARTSTVRWRDLPKDSFVKGIPWRTKRRGAGLLEESFA